ncbi:hypothetical protein GGR57DRAFT_507199 [Xylariaceae sp. FL1272]|nr:hypothetical protein GGR57DRAFT_507199 [Xylariaceae sp. FL1272]
MTATSTEPLKSAGGPLFRRRDISHEQFCEAWHTHAKIVMPWCLKFGVWEYVQIHMPSTTSSLSRETSEDRKKEIGIESEQFEKARKILQQADGVAIMRRYQIPVEGGNKYFKEEVLVDERRFLHDESGAGAVVGEKPVFDVPGLEVDVWRVLALEMGGVEHVKIKDGEDVVGGAVEVPEGQMIDAGIIFTIVNHGNLGKWHVQSGQTGAVFLEEERKWEQGDWPFLFDSLGSSTSTPAPVS